MNIDAYLNHIPTIEKWIVEHRLDSLVIGMGPTGWLVPWLDRSIIKDLRLWGCHDASRILPMDDLIIMDLPQMALNPDTTRYKHIIEARPKRLWVYERNYPHWAEHIQPCMKPVTTTVKWAVFPPQKAPPMPALEKVAFKLEADPPHTTAISPTGMTTLAWQQGCRRIGVIGVDMMKNHHHTYRNWPLVDVFFRKIAAEADERGGCVVNLSPVTSLRGFASWKRCTSTSAPIAGSKPQEPSASSNTASASTQLATLPSTGCAAETLGGRLAPTEPAVPGA
jgi:hypothetical protein